MDKTKRQGDIAIWFPARELELYSPLSINEARERLHQSLNTPYLQYILPKEWEKKVAFHGTVEGEHFHMKRCFSDYNNYIPIVSGAFLPSIGGSKIVAKVSMEKRMLYFTLIWFSICLFTILSALVNITSTTYLPLLMTNTTFMIWIFVVWGGFYTEVTKVKKFLCQTLHAVEYAKHKAV